MVYISLYPSAPITLRPPIWCFYTHLKSRKIAVRLIYFSHFIHHKQNLTNRTVAIITAFNFVYNHCFHYETDCLSFGKQVQYQRVGLTQYLISHHPSLGYLDDTNKTFLRIFGIYQTAGCHTHNNAIFLLATVVNSEFLQTFVNAILFLFVYKTGSFELVISSRASTECMDKKFAH